MKKSRSRAEVARLTLKRWERPTDPFTPVGSQSYGVSKNYALGGRFDFHANFGDPQACRVHVGNDHEEAIRAYWELYVEALLAAIVDALE